MPTPDHLKKYLGFNGKELYQLFCSTALQIHLWAFYQVLQDIEWISRRTVSWDGIGVMGYALSFALFESLLLSQLIPRKWDSEKRLLVSGVLYFLVAIIAILIQVAAMNDVYLIEKGGPFLVETGRPVWYGSWMLIGLLLDVLGILLVFYRNIA